MNCKIRRSVRLRFHLVPAAIGIALLPALALDWSVTTSFGPTIVNDAPSPGGDPVGDWLFAQEIFETRTPLRQSAAGLLVLCLAGAIAIPLALTKNRAVVCTAVAAAFILGNTQAWLLRPNDPAAGYLIVQWCTAGLAIAGLCRLRRPNTPTNTLAC